jgi:hypothetical protein
MGLAHHFAYGLALLGGVGIRDAGRIGLGGAGSRDGAKKPTRQQKTAQGCGRGGEQEAAAEQSIHVWAPRRARPETQGARKGSEHGPR